MSDYAIIAGVIVIALVMLLVVPAAIVAGRADDQKALGENSPPVQDAPRPGHGPWYEHAARCQCSVCR